jgi:hypothetical protein
MVREKPAFTALTRKNGYKITSRTSIISRKPGFESLFKCRNLDEQSKALHMKKFFFFLLASLPALLGAQAAFQRAYSFPVSTSTYDAQSVVQCNDDGFLVTCHDNGSAGLLIRTDANGIVQWSHQFSNQTTADGYYLIGATEAPSGYYLLAAPSNVYNSMLVEKLDVNGNYLWSQVYNGTDNSYYYSKIRTTSDGGFMISESAFTKMGATRCDANGNVLWSYSYSGDSLKNPSFDCQILNDGSMLFTGKRMDDIILMKTDAGGQMLWSKVMNDGSSYYHANAVTATSTGGCLVAGYDDSFPFVMKTDANGNMTWYHVWTDSTASWGIGTFEQVVELANGNFLLSGFNLSYAPFIAIMDPNGNIIEAREIINYTGGPEVGVKPVVCATSDGGYALAARCTDQNGNWYITLSKSANASALPCATSPFNMTLASAITPPVTLSVPIIRTTETIMLQPLLYSDTALTAVTTDYCQLLGIKEKSEETFVRVFPLPAAQGENVVLSMNGIAGTVLISIYDPAGKLVLQKNALAGTTPVTIETTGLAPAVYIVRITSQSNGKLVATTRFIVQN